MIRVRPFFPCLKCRPHYHNSFCCYYVSFSPPHQRSFCLKKQSTLSDTSRTQYPFLLHSGRLFFLDEILNAYHGLGGLLNANGLNSAITAWRSKLTNWYVYKHILSQVLRMRVMSSKRKRHNWNVGFNYQIYI